MLQHAHENYYAVVAINCTNMEQARAIIGAATAENAPVIVNISPRQMKAHASPEIMVPMIKALAEQTHVPVALNLDHGQLYEDINRVMKAGFSSVMIDASALEFEENIKRTRLITIMAHEKGLSVEAELGHVGIAQDGDDAKADLYTNPDQALDYVQRTNIDCLAVAIGTAHGNYPKGIIPKLDFERLKVLKQTLKIPLVLHGGSGAGEDNIKKVVSLGINKINVCTDLFRIGRKAMVDAALENPNIDYMDFQIVGEQAMKTYIQSFMKMIGSSGRYVFDQTTTKEVE
ncbi:class II fructose-bisphosphate aldolase [Erysipelothrix larvae]